MKRKEIQLRVTISYPEKEEPDIFKVSPGAILTRAIYQQYRYKIEDVEFIDNNKIHN